MALDANAVLVNKSLTSSYSDPSLHSFQAQAVYFLGDTRLDKCLLGAVNYANSVIKITLAHKVEDWLFCVEQNLLTNEGIYIGAFYLDRHYTFTRLCNVETPIKSVAFQFQCWIFEQVLGLFYQDGVLVLLQNAFSCFKPAVLKDKRVVPNDQSVSHFLLANGEILPTVT